MAGKKKKTLANKLAKMSDDDRARYLQHRADMEEEAKRRKEQLISTFMKNKIKKEDAFSRLNVAKINQQWHQILRKAKCQEMRENIGHMKRYIERIVAYKNRTISKLLEELEAVEEQYLNNFQSHSSHVDEIIESQNDYINKLQKQYEDDLQKMIETSISENKVIVENAKGHQQHLQTIIYGQDVIAKKAIREKYETYMMKINEILSHRNSEFKFLKKSRQAISGALWRQIATVVKQYVHQTDSRRLHLAELKRIDTESAAEISNNQERIMHEEEETNLLKEEYKTLCSTSEESLKNLDIQFREQNKNFIKAKQQLHQDISSDDKRLRFLADHAHKTTKHLKGISTKGEYILSLMYTCRKFETEREKITKWLPICDIEDEFKDLSKREECGEEIKNIKEMAESLEYLDKKKATDKVHHLPRTRPKTSVAEAISKSGRNEAIDTANTPEETKIMPFKEIVIHAKKSVSFENSSSSASSNSSEGNKFHELMGECFESLKNMDNFWWSYNKVQVDYREMKEEKKLLRRENKELRGTIRALLEAAVMSQTIPNSKVSTRVASRRSGYSAPLRRIFV